MRSLLISIVFLLPVLVACEKASDLFEDYLNKGTNIGYMRCLEKNKDQGIGNNTVEALCKKKHEKSIYAKLEGKAGYYWEYGTLCKFQGYLENKSKDFIITFVEISVNHQDNKDNKGNIITEKLELENLWIEPHQKSEFKDRKSVV